MDVKSEITPYLQGVTMGVTHPGPIFSHKIGIFMGQWARIFIHIKCRLSHKFLLYILVYIDCIVVINWAVGIKCRAMPSK